MRLGYATLDNRLDVLSEWQRDFIIVQEAANSSDLEYRGRVHELIQCNSRDDLGA
ncbi:hypothetical protein Plhal304r1_c012g0046281 [Plasmopara halstedii]